MWTSTRGRNEIKKREGVRLTTYKDSVGVLTLGVGHTAMAGNPIPMPGMTITEDEADKILTRDLIRYENYVKDALKVEVSQNEFDALVSICFNVGPKFAESTCIKRLNAGDRAGAAEAIMLWNKPPEIVGRRRSEYQQFKTPYPGLVQPSKPATTGGAVIAGTTAGASAGAAAQQAGLPMWAVALIVAGASLAGFLIWKFWK